MNQAGDAPSGGSLVVKDLGMSIKVPAHNVKVKLYKHVTPDALVAQLLHSEIESNLNPRTDKVVIYSRNIQ